jgi:hypothetical protein
VNPTRVTFACSAKIVNNDRGLEVSRNERPI